jgi:hypothetical protein
MHIVRGVFNNLLGQRILTIHQYVLIQQQGLFLTKIIGIFNQYIRFQLYFKYTNGMLVPSEGNEIEMLMLSIFMTK